MTTTINISVNIPQGYGITKLTQQLTEYAHRLVAEESFLQSESDDIILSEEMVAAAKQAEQDYREGKCVGMEDFNRRVAKWL
jgi:hypothetical protein